MTKAEIAAEIARRVSDAEVYELAERMDCTLLVARGDLEALAFAAVTGLPLNYHTDWRNLPEDYVVIPERETQ